MPRAVDKGRLGEGFGDSHKGGPHDDHVVGTDGKGNDKTPEGIGQVEVTERQVEGDHAPGEEHGKGDGKHDGFFEEHILAGKEVSPQGSHEETYQNPYNQYEQGVPVPQEDHGILKDHTISGGTETQGLQEQPCMLHQKPVAAKGREKYIKHGVKAYKGHKDKKNIVKDRENIFAPGVKYPVTCFFHGFPLTKDSFPKICGSAYWP
jgi:hypothetical protein